MAIEMRADRIAASMGTASFRFLFIDRSGSGLRKVDIRDRDGVGLAQRPPLEEGSCPETHMTEVVDVMRSRFPLSARAEDCSGEVTPPEVFGPIGTSVLIDGPGVPMGCTGIDCPPNPDCDAAESEARLQRRLFARACGEVAAQRERLVWFATLAALLILSLTVLAVTAAAVQGIPFVGTAIALGIFAVMAVVAAMLVLVMREMAKERRVLEEERRQLNVARDRFLGAAQAVNERCCCPDADLSMPC